LAAQGPVSAALGAADRSYLVRGGAAGLSALNAAQRLRVGFDRAGVSVRSGSSTMALGLAAIGYGNRLRAVRPAAPRYRGNRVWFDRGLLREWYVNGPLGLEQGFTIPRRVSGGAGPLMLSLGASGLRPELERGSVLFKSRQGAVVFRYGSLLAVDATGTRMRSWLALRGGTVQMRVDARGARYPLRIDPFVQQGSKLRGCCASEPAQQGDSVAVSADGNTALIGGPDAPPDQEASCDGDAAWVFIRSGWSWSQQAKLVGTGTTCSEQGFGVALSADGNTALVGGLSGAYAFIRSGSTWSQQGSELVGTGAVGNASQGRSVALSADGSTALIGGPEDNNQTGAAWVFTRSGSTWSQQGPKLLGSRAVGGAWQGFSVALSGDGNTALIGGPEDNNQTGAAWVFTRSGSTWSQQGPKLVGTGAAGSARQGWSVALSGDGNTAMLGGPRDAASCGDCASNGAAWVFIRSGSTWSQQGPKLVGSGAVGRAGQGEGVGLAGDGNTALVGGPDDNSALGAVWVFARSGSSWSQQGEKLVGTGGVPGTYGVVLHCASVALSRDGLTALVGGPGDRGFAGATWVFVVTGPPSISSLTPTSGITGSHVTITGTNLGSTSSLKFGRLQAPFTVLSDTQIKTTVPDGAVAAPISVTTGAGITTSSQSFTPTWSITGLSPTSGPVGTVVDIRGIGFTPGSTVKFNGTAATVSYIGSGEVKATVPPGASSGPVTLTTAAGTVRARTSYTVTPSVPPTISSVTPISGITGSVVTITGTYLSGASSVKFGSLAASRFTVRSPTSITATVPNGATAGKITVTTAAGTATSSTAFTPTLSITGFSPSSGPPGTVVDLKGIGFTASSTVQFNGTVAAASYVSPGKVKATVPAGATTGRITLTNTSTPAGTVTSGTNYKVT
jgi:hypothetical protein